VLVLSGHLDTVFPEGTDVTVRMRGDTLYAPGIADDTRGLIAVLTVLRAMNAADLRTEGDVWFVGTVGEEGLGDLRGVKHLFRKGGPRIDAFISIDGAGDRRVVHQALGSRRYRTTVRGPGGHSWGAFGLANPAHALGRAIHAFDQAASDFVAEGPRTSYNVGVIGGGTSVNSIPFEAWMEVDMRSADAGRLMGIDSLYRAAIGQAVEEQNQERLRGEPLSIDLDLVGDRPSGEIDPATPFVQRAMATVRHFGWEPELQRSSTDANVPIALGIPAVTMGGGGVAGGAHSLDEWWLNRDGHLAIQRTLLLVLAEAGLAAR
jgi:tripeptide aminopeptidase